MIILDMEMPSNCDECRLKETDQYTGMGRCLAYKMDKPLASNKLYKKNLLDNKKPEWCPIKVEIPANVTNGDALEQEPRTGHWICTLEDWNKWECSECGFTKRTDVHVRIGYKYCPNCGCRMESEG